MHESVEVGACRRHRCENPRGLDGRSGPVPGPVSCWCSDCGNGRLDGAASDHLRFGKSDPGDPARDREVDPRRRDHRDGTIRLSQSDQRSEEHTSELQSLMRISYAVFCLKKKKKTHEVSQVEHTNHTKKS